MLMVLGIFFVRYFLIPTVPVDSWIHPSDCLIALTDSFAAFADSLKTVFDVKKAAEETDKELVLMELEIPNWSDR